MLLAYNSQVREVVIMFLGKDDMQIDSGSDLGTDEMNIFIGVGIEIKFLNMIPDYTTQDVNDQDVKLGGDQWYPMPFLAISGRLKLDKRHTSVNNFMSVIVNTS